MFVFLMFCSIAAEPVWQWPIDPKFGVSATFGEYRGERFHMGLDFSTGGAEGMLLKPAREGVVFQVRAQDRGYGKAVYVRHPDRMVTVYAHLAAFGPGLKAAIQAAGKNPSQAFGTLALAYPIKASDTLGWSGESGAGMPHLHFEVRDAENRPVDPLTLNFPTLTIPIRSKIRGLRLLPLSENARVNEGRFPRTFSPDKGPIQARGRLGVQVDAALAAPRDNTLAPRGIRLLVDGRVLASWQPTRIDFADYRRAGTVIDQAFSGFGPTRYFYTFDGRHQSQAALPGLVVDGILEVRDKPRRLRVEITGFDGALHREEWILDPKAKPGQRLAGTPDPELPLQPTSLRLRHFGQTLVVTAAERAGTLFLPDQMRALAPGESWLFSLKDAPSPLRFAWRTDAGNLKREVALIGPDRAKNSTLGPFRLEVTEKPALPTTGALIQPADPKQGKGVLDFVSPVLSFGRQGLPVSGLRLHVDAAVANDPQVALYYWSFVKKRWRYHGPVKAGGSGVKVDVLEPLVLARDLVPPVIRAPKLHRYFEGPRVVIPIVERGSGVNRDSVTVRDKNGVVPSAYDGDRRWIVLQTEPSRGPWDVRVSDRAGLDTTVTQLRRPSR